jgi:hypothetical protein
MSQMFALLLFVVTQLRQIRPSLKNPPVFAFGIELGFEGSWLLEISFVGEWRAQEVMTTRKEIEMKTQTNDTQRVKFIRGNIWINGCREECVCE